MGKRKGPSILQALGDAIRSRRVELELTQHEIGQAADLHRTYVTDVENGLRNVSLLTLVRLAKALQSPPSQLLVEAEALHGWEH
jgi:transcriptional regulator with XRE-family HTH domain